MHLVKGRRYMEKFNTKIVRKDEDFILTIKLRSETIEFSLTEDKPEEVRAAFNRLIVLLKSSPIVLTFKKEGDDLYQQIGEEYIKQLNRELSTVRNDLEEYEMVLDDEK